jgi:hypothetical protein
MPVSRIRLPKNRPHQQGAAPVIEKEERPQTVKGERFAPTIIRGTKRSPRESDRIGAAVEQIDGSITEVKRSTFEDWYQSAVRSLPVSTFSGNDPSLAVSPNAFAISSLISRPTD